MLPSSFDLSFLLIVLCNTFSEAQVSTLDDNLPPSPPPPGSDHCKVGDLIPGPTCNSFYMCVGPLYAAKKVKFQCAPGTVFDDELNTCVHGIGSKCLESFPVLPPAPSPPPPSPPLPSPPLPEVPVADASSSDGCCEYQLHPTSIFDCPEPGYFPSLTDCSRFYKCIVTMNCIMKGYMFRCPSNYQFDPRKNRCVRKEEARPCNVQSDAAGQTHIVTPVVDLTSDVLDDFFQADAYWSMMKFLPEEDQRIVAVNPATFSRDSSRGFFMQDQ